MTALTENDITIDFSRGAHGLHPRIGLPETRHARRSTTGLSNALRLMAALQTTLDLEPLIRLFSREVNSSVPHSSARYWNEAKNINLTAGRTAKHSCNYQLILEKRKLGRISFSRGKPFTPRETTQLEYLLCSLVYPLRNALRYKNAFEASLTDPLTGVYNRTFMDAALRREIALAHRHKIPLSLIIIDIDGFKKVNDEFGHTTGDNLIRTISDSVSLCLRETDMLSRYGGDEFTILLSNTDRKGVTVLAKNIKDKLNDTAYQLNGNKIALTVSMGAATLSQRNKKDDLFSRADAALYQAKREGRNRIRIAGATNPRATLITETSGNKRT